MADHTSRNSRRETPPPDKPVAGGILSIVSIFILALALFIFLGREPLLGEDIGPAAASPDRVEAAVSGLMAER